MAETKEIFAEQPEGYVYARLDDLSSIFAGTCMVSSSPEYLLDSEVFPTKEALRKACPTPGRGYYLAKITNKEIHYLEGPRWRSPELESGCCVVLARLSDCHAPSLKFSRSVRATTVNDWV
jgi:hypothetical protein